MPLSSKQITCHQCANFSHESHSTTGLYKEWEAQIKRGVSEQQNAHFYRAELGGDGFYSNCEFLPDEQRNCQRFSGVYRFVVEQKP
jgi:hypothetical protein